jgi:hypothetical protein
MCRMLGVLSVKPFPIRKWLLDANPGLLGLSLRGKNAPHRDGLGYAFRDPKGRWHLFRFGPKALLEAEIPGPVDREATVLLAHARKSSPEFASFRGGLYAHPFFYDGVFLCHNGTVRDIERLGLSHGTDSQRLLFWLSKRWKPRTPDRLKDCLRELLGIISDFSASEPPSFRWRKSLRPLRVPGEPGVLHPLVPKGSGFCGRGLGARR